MRCCCSTLAEAALRSTVGASRRAQGKPGFFTLHSWMADVNGDGKIDILDLIFVRNHLNTNCP